MIDPNLANDQMKEDLSLLQQSLQTAFVGFQEAKRAFEDGTDEVRRLLLYECSLIYECNVCRNLFRSLANFISHKRAFCCHNVYVTGYPNGFTDNNSAVIIQAPEIDVTKRSRSTGSSPAPDSRTVKKSTRDICRVIERLKREKAENDEKVKNDDNTENKHEEPVLQLERVPTSANAVYQTVKRMKADSMKTEVDEVHNLLTNTKTVVGPDGKAFTKHTYDTAAAVNSCNENLGELFCKICNLGFQTDKTLQIHMQKKHIDSTYVYQCPACSITFLKSAHVIRHLANEHKKSPRRIRLMREGIMKRRVRQCDVQVKGPSRELKRLQLNKDDININAPTMEKNSKWSVLSSCLHCDQRFERRATLSAHLLKCSAKQEALNKSPSVKITRPLIKIHNLLSGDEKETVQSSEQEIEPLTLKQELSDSQELNEMFANLQTQSYGVGLQTISLERLEMTDSSDSMESSVTNNTFVDPATTMIKSEQEFFTKTDLENKEQIKLFEVKKEKEEKYSLDGNNSDEKLLTKLKGKRKRIPPTDKLTACRCKICNKQFNAISNLRRHISMYHYRARRFGCKLCDYHAFRSYDIVNHLMFMHKMTENRDTLAKDFVDRHDVNYSKKDTEEDILLVSESIENTVIKKIISNEIAEIKEEEKPIILKTYERRKIREKTDKVTGSMNNIVATTTKAIKDVVDVKISRKNLKRACSQELEGALKSEICKQLDKRPMRRRIKPINNDFVYDLSALLKKDMQPQDREGTRVMRRRFTVVSTEAREPVFDALVGAIKNAKVEEILKPPLPLINLSGKEMIKSSTRRIVMRMVGEARAALSTMPDLPTERPQMRPVLTSSYQDEIQAGPIIDANDLEEARRKATLLDDAFLDKFTSHSASTRTFKIKPCLEVHHGKLSSLLEKMDTTLQNKNASQLLNKRTTLENNINEKSKLITCATNEATELSNFISTARTTALNTITTVEQSNDEHTDLETPNDGKVCIENNITPTITPPPTPRKRFTLLKHLADNKQRKLDSLLRSALQN